MAALREGARWTGPNSFNFMQLLGKFLKFVCWRPPPPPSWRPHLGEILDQPLLRLKISVSQFKMSEGPFGLDENDAEFLCRQKWVAWLPMSLFTHDDKKVTTRKHFSRMCLLTVHCCISCLGGGCPRKGANASKNIGCTWLRIFENFRSFSLG